jgi:ATP-dependent Clp protease ATP-binding subunit ClpC
MPLSPRASLAIQYAEDVAREWGDEKVLTEHLLLGLIREDNGIASAVLEGLGVSQKIVSSIKFIRGVPAGTR